MKDKMPKMKKRKKLTAAIILMSVFALLAGCAAGDEKQDVDDRSQLTLSEALEYYSDGRIGVQTGSTLVSIAEEYFPDADICYFSNGADIKTALLNGKIDAFLLDKPNVEMMYKEDPSFYYYEETLYTEYMAFGFNKNTGTKLCAEMNEFLKEIEQSGVKSNLEEKWTSADDYTAIEIDIDELIDINGTLSVVSDITFPPFEYYRGADEIAGLEMEMLALFAKEYGYALDIKNVDFSSVVLNIASGKSDMAASALSITDERKESVLFSDPFYESGPVLCVPNTSADENGNSIAGSFNKTFIKDSRWKLFAQGMLVTLMISSFAIVAGTVLGFGVFEISRRGGKIINLTTNFIYKLIHGMPVVVFLMLMYYLVFGKSRMSGVWISAIAFMIIFALEVASILSSGSKVIDAGQIEAAYMLGYSERKAFNKIILPQIVINSISSYSSAIVSLVLSTAVVGYVAVEDITKVGDIVRSRTYEAFFPLIVTAGAYFILSWIVTIPARIIKRRFDPETRKIVIKGGNRDD